MIDADSLMDEGTRMIQPTVMLYLTIPMALASPVLVSCASPNGTNQPQPSVSAANSDNAPAEETLTKEELIQQSWVAYKDRFIQTDGRVIDRGDETNPDRTVSEGQAYAMLRAVMIDDPDTFEKTLQWAEENLARTTPEGELIDTLWAWKWGQDEQGQWTILDKNFATDADIDAATALILAARRWNRPDYLELAKVKLQDIWDFSTVPTDGVTSSSQTQIFSLIEDEDSFIEQFAEEEPEASVPNESATPAQTNGATPAEPLAEPAVEPSIEGTASKEEANEGGSTQPRYLIPGPVDAFQPQPNLIYLNPSYFAPYAFRLFAQVDEERDWLSLVDSSYDVLEASSEAFPSGLPSDWIAMNTDTFEFYPVQSPRLNSVYSFDAYRVWWRVALDAIWFDEPRATDYLRSHLPFLEMEWRSHQRIPARIDLQGNALVDYEATGQYGMLYFAFRVIDPAIADEIYRQKLLPTYRDGFWDNDSAYYTHNLSWFGIYPPNQVSSTWLSP